MTGMKKVIYVDFDETLVNTKKAICKLYNEDYKFYSDFEEVDSDSIVTWEFAELKAAKPEHINLYFNQERFFNELEFLDLYDELKEIHELGYEVKIISLGYSPNLRIKERFCKKWYPFAEFVGINMKQYKNKAHIDMSGCFFVDDSLNNIRSSNAGMKILFGNYGWNKDVLETDDISFRADNWNDILIYLQHRNQKGVDE